MIVRNLYLSSFCSNMRSSVLTKNKYDCHVSSIKDFCMKNNVKNLQYIPINWQKTFFEKIYIPRSSLIITDLVKRSIAYYSKTKGNTDF